MLRLLLLFPFFFFLAACAGTSKGVVKCGQGVHAVSGSPNHPYGNYLDTSRNVALDRANTFCRSKDKRMFVETIEEGLPTHIKFRCLAEGDPKLEQQPPYEYQPTFTIKDPCNPSGS